MGCFFLGQKAEAFVFKVEKRPNPVVELDLSFSVSSPEEGERKFTLTQAIALNTLMMFGTGPFITIPFCIASTEPAGPQALIGYAVAGLACLCDSFIWAELGALYPDSGGSYIYLQKAIGRKWGRLMSFLFLWQVRYQSRTGRFVLEVADKL